MNDIEPAPFRTVFRWWTLGLCIWTGLAALSALQLGLYTHSVGNHVPWSTVFALRFADWYSCALFLPLLYWIAGRFPFDRAHWRQSLAVHLVASTLVVLAKCAVFFPVGREIAMTPLRSFSQLLTGSAITELMTFWSVMVALHAVEFYRRLRERERAALEMAARLSAARLEALRAQLHPHFLFNTINGIAALVHSDQKRADRALMNLAELLRVVLERSDRHEIALREEIELLNRYLDIAGLRFSDRLQIEYAIPVALEGALVPCFVLQPLVENALEHAVGLHEGHAVVSVKAHADDDSLVIHVSDDGAGNAARGVRRKGGIGLTNTRRRLAEMYGSHHSLTLEPRTGGGMNAVLTLPLRFAAALEPASVA